MKSSCVSCRWDVSSEEDDGMERAGYLGYRRAQSGRMGLLAKGVGRSTMKKLECFPPVWCHCKLARSSSAVSLVFGCKVGARGQHGGAGRARELSSSRL